MRPFPHHKPALSVLALLLAALTTAQATEPGRKGPKEPDRADLRALANLEWFGGQASPEYLDFKARVAEQELQKWAPLIPGTKAHLAGIRMAGIPENAWTNIGPKRGQGQLYVVDTNIADTGRPTVILPHPTNPNLLYVGYAGGGLWRCSNADVTAAGDWTWTPLTDALPAGSPAGNLSIGGAAFKPEDASTLYLALGDMEPGSADSTAEGRGFFISTDGGNTWARGGALGATTRVKTVLALPGNLVLVSGNAGLFRSTDGGASFTAISSAPLSGVVGWDLRKLDNGDLVVSHDSASGGGVAYSTDNGLSWTAATFDATITGFGLGRIGLAAKGATLYGLFEDASGAFQKGVMKSTDNGRTWAWLGSTDLFNVGGDGGQAGYNHLIAVDPANVNTVFVGTNLSLYRSLNGGVSWERMTQWMGNDRHYLHADYHVHAWAPTGPKALYIGTDGGLAVVRNPDIATIPTGSGGMLSDPTFIDNRRNRNISTQLIYHVGSTTAATPAGANQRVIIGLQDQGTRLRSETGVATQSYDLAIGGDGFGCLIHPYDGNKMLGSLYYSRIYRSANGGTNWAQGTGITGAGSNATAPFFTRLGQDLSDPTGNRVYTYNRTVPFSSSDFGATWTAMPTTGLASVSSIRNIVASPLTPNHVAVALNGGRVGITTNGTSWTTIAASAFPNNGSFMNGVAFDTADPQILYASSVAFSATNSHLWKSINGGAAWTAVDVSNGFPFGVPVHMVKVDPLDHNTVYAGTDLGLYRSTDGGASWARFGSGLPLVSVRDIYLAPDGTFMRIGTHGRGVWEMQGVSTNYAPQISSQPRNWSVYEGQTATTGLVAVGLPAPTFQWQVSTNGTTWTDITTNGTASTYTLPAPATLADSGKQFRAVVSNSAGSVTSNPATLTVTPATPPTFTLHPASLTQIAGLRVDFTGSASAAPAPSYQWQGSPDGVAWTNVAGATSSLYKFYPSFADNNKQFRLVASNMGGTVNSNAATLSLTPYLTQTLVNPDFEVAPFGTGWTWSHTPTSMQDTGNVHEGTSAAVFGYWGAVTTDWAYQDVTLPASPTSAGLSFWLKIWGPNIGPGTAVNTMAAKVKTPGGTDLGTLATFDNTTTGYASFAKVGPLDLKPYAGQTVRIYFTSVQPDAAINTAFTIDDVNLLVNTTPTGPTFDINLDGMTDVYDLLELLKRFGSTAPADLAKADFNSDGQINDADLTALLSAL